jgi:hypothetical protein
VQLDVAAKLFKDADILTNEGIEEADIMFEGDEEMWRKLVNTQRLKLLIRQSELFGSTPPTAELAKITADGSGFLMEGETAAVNPGYSNAEFQLNPFYNAYAKNFAGANADDFNRANNYVLNKLRSSNDIRYQYYFSPAATPLNNNTYFGYDFGFVDQNPDQPKAGNSSNVAGKGLAKSPSQDQWIFTSVESLFLQAEAKQRGWIAGDPKAAFEDAVIESFNWLGTTRVDVTNPGPPAVTVTRNADYLADEYLSQNIPLVDYAAAADKVKFIVMHKYLSLVGINNFEAWVDYRRLGVPTDLPPSLSPSRNNRNVPLRLLYPQEEYSFNSTNVTAQGVINAQTSKVFWDVN